MKSKEELKQMHNEVYVAAFKRHSTLRLKKILDYIDLKDGLDIADYACGNGLLMELAAPTAKSYAGIDFSEPFIREANLKKHKLHIDNARFFCGDISEFCRQFHSSFDAAFAMDFSEHVYDEDWINILRQIRTSLKPGGKLYIHTPNAYFFIEKMKSNNFILRQFPEHIAVRTPQENAVLLEKAGYKVSRTWLIPHYNAMKHIHFLSYIPIIGKYFKARILIEAAA
ncbi:MAG: class I SAM-dependent methyltransferase [Alcanivoracaceae bacterium]